jgi:predicted nucleic acid-binding protein
MRVLLDTNILLRISDPAHPHHQPAVRSLKALAVAGGTFTISSQNVYEFLAVATRPLQDRGLGMNQTTADRELRKLIGSLHMVYDSVDVVMELRRLMIVHGISGKSIHDARLAATMNVYGIADILTFNVKDFVRFAGINVLDPTVVGRAVLP